MRDVIERACDGDRDALALLWREHNHLLLRYFISKQMASPDDLASIVWVEVASSLHRFEGDEHDFRRWLFTIAARRRIDDIRAAKRQQRRDERNRATTVDTAAHDSAEDADRAASLSRALALVAQLPDDQAEAVRLRVIADLNVAEVAAIMGRREGHVRVLVHRGLKRLATTRAVTDDQYESMFSP